MDMLQRKVIQEDTVVYKLFLVPSTDSSPTEECFTHLIEDLFGKLSPLLAQYIWHHQPFHLKYHPEKGDVPAHLAGSTQFTDNVEDEWFIVYLLQQITNTFPELAARVEDNDGEFLLIEAADHLPKWINPDSSENRVFVYRGDLHIIPLRTKNCAFGFPKDVTPSLPDALSLLASHPEACRANSKISTAFKSRLKGYPEKIQTDLHHAHCFIPAGISLVLAKRPDLVAPAVSAFYLRDPIDLQACRSFKTFPPDTCILTRVTFTRCLYAQLQQQQFTPDRRSGFALPPRSDPKYRAHELGMKLAHGFEILCSKARMPASEPNAPVSCNPQWKGFIKSLKGNGYFKGAMEGSAPYRDLMNSAENFFRQSVSSEFNTSSPGEEVLQVLHTCTPFSLEELREKEAQLPPEDSDKWLDITEQDFEQMLRERGKGYVFEGNKKDPICNSKVEALCGPVEETAGYSLVAVSQGMKSFLNAMSSHEGAELPGSTMPFNFDPCSMASALDKLLGTKESEELDSDDLDDDDDDDDNDDDDESIGGREEEAADDLNGPEALENLKKYMDQMDEELMKTNIGQSFLQNNNKADPQNKPSQSLGDGSTDTDEMEEDIQPLDLDLNLVTNLLESLSSQAGLAGPASNLLQSLGITLPPNSDPS